MRLREQQPDGNSARAGYALLRHVHALCEAVRVTRRERPFHIDAWVVLPDHLHCVSTLPPVGRPTGLHTPWGEI